MVIGANKNFSPGFDIAQFKNNSGGGGIDNTINDAICLVLESGPKPTVAAVNGVALGGGLEVAMGCNARVVTPGTKLGLPELSLGILPGFGGTQRLPRLVGLKKAIEIMLTSQVGDARPCSRQELHARGTSRGWHKGQACLCLERGMATDLYFLHSDRRDRRGWLDPSLGRIVTYQQADQVKGPLLTWKKLHVPPHLKS